MFRRECASCEHSREDVNAITIWADIICDKQSSYCSKVFVRKWDCCDKYKKRK